METTCKTETPCNFGTWHIGAGFGDTLFIRKAQPDGRGEIVTLVNLFKDEIEELPDGSKLIRKVPIRDAREKAVLIAAAPDLLAVARCSWAMDCAKADPSYDPRPILKSYGWNEAENIGLFLSRIRRAAIEKAGETI